MRVLLAIILALISSATTARAELYIELPNGRWLCVPDGLLLLGGLILVAALVAYGIWAIAENWEFEQRRSAKPQSSALTGYDREAERVTEFSRRLDEEAARDEERLRAALQQETLNFEELFRRFEEDSAHRRGR